MEEAKAENIIIKEKSDNEIKEVVIVNCIIKWKSYIEWCNQGVTHLSTHSLPKLRFTPPSEVVLTKLLHETEFEQPSPTAASHIEKNNCLLKENSLANG